MFVCITHCASHLRYRRCPFQQFACITAIVAAIMIAAMIVGHTANELNVVR